LDSLPSIILKNGETENWRKAPGKVGFYLDLALLIDPHLSKPTKEWSDFRESALAKWKSRLDHAGKDGKPLSGTPKVDGEVSASSPKSESDPFGEFPAFAEEKRDEKPPVVGFPTVETDRFSSFPASDKPSTVSTDGFPAAETDPFSSFPEIEEPSQVSTGGFPPAETDPFNDFPAIEEPSKVAPGSFPTVETDPFSNFPEIEEPSKVNSGGFPTVEESMEDPFNNFPAIDDLPDSKDPKTMAGGGFPTASGDAFGEFPDFDEPNVGDTASLGVFPEVAPSPPPSPPPASISVIGQIVSPSAKVVAVDPDEDLSYDRFMELIANPCWEYTGPSPAELFGQKDKFSDVDAAYSFLAEQSDKQEKKV
jgi:hypothetical protein